MEENKISVLQLAKDVFHNFFKLIGDLKQLANLEAELARKSLVKIIILSFFLITLFTTTWFCVLALLVVLLISFNFTFLASIAIVTGINLVITLILGLVIFKLKKNLHFNATKRQLRHTKTLLKG